jgi:hypothetical protein
MRKVLVVLPALLLLTLAASSVNAQPIPNIQVYFTTEYGVYGKTHLDECPGVGVVDQIYIVASNFNMWMIAVEYKVQYPPYVSLVADVTGGIDIGFSDVGIATSWPLPQNAFVPFAVNKPWIQYNCEGCPCDNICFKVVPNPSALSGQVQAVRWPDNALIIGVGMESLICPTIPVEDTSWGQIKALYDK